MRFQLPASVRRLGRRQPQVGPADVAGLTWLGVDPELTDPEIRGWREPHQIVLPAETVPGAGLLVFLAGSGGNARRQQSFLAQAALLGYHAVNLRYPNSWTVGGLARRARSEEAHERIRRQIIDGQVGTEVLDMHPADSILNRLTRLLGWLAREHPQHGWGGYVDNDAIQWSSVLLAGHSQGGGHCALMAKMNAVRRVLLFGAPVDFDRESDALAGWLGQPGATTGDRHYGLVHRLDPGFERIMEAWELLGMAEFGPVVNVDSVEPPYGDSHRLTTDREPEARGRHHGSVVVDGATPRAAGGAPVLQPVWAYMLRP